MTELTLLVVPVLLAMLVARIAVRQRAARRRWRTALLAGLPLPAAGLAFCAWVFAAAVLTPAPRCGTDACGMAMAAAYELGLLCVLAYALSVGAVALILGLQPRWRR